MKEEIYDPQFTRELFNRMSASYDAVHYTTSFGFSKRWRRQFLKHIPASAEKPRVIDLLAGMGETWPLIKTHFPGAELTALDFSASMIKHAQARNHKLFKGSVKIMERDLLNTHLTENYYDIAVCAFGLKTFNPSQLGVLAQQTRRILKPGGSFSFIEISKPPNKLLRALYGFHLARVVPFLCITFTGNPSDYKMLWKYCAQYGDSRLAASTFESVGLVTTYDSYFFGCATGIHGYKPMDS